MHKISSIRAGSLQPQAELCFALLANCSAFFDPSANLPPDMKSPRGLPVAIWALGFGSLLMDTSSELLHSLTPVLLVNVPRCQ